MLELRACKDEYFEDYDGAILQNPNSPLVMFESYHSNVYSLVFDKTLVFDST